MIEQKCHNEYDGALHFKWINIIVRKVLSYIELIFFLFKRKAGDSLDKDGSDFLRLHSDGPPTFEGPFIMAVNVEK